MDMKFYFIFGCLLSTVTIINAYRKRHRHAEGKGSRALSSTVEIEQDDKGVIDLDDMATFDVALEHYPEGQVEKHREDTREVRIDGEFVPVVEQSNDVHINEGENASPLSIVSGLQSTGQSYDVFAGNFTDDEDLTSGSGSGDVMIKDATEEYANFPDANDTVVSEPTTQADFPPLCEERIGAVWAPWSPWIQSGDQDIRFRRCQDVNKFKVSSDDCPGEFFQTRSCPVTDEHMCRLTDGVVTTEYMVQCDGLNLNDMDNIDALRSPLDIEDDCEYTLFDVKYRMAIGNSLSTLELNQADRKLWCTARDKYIPFHSPHQRCHSNLETFCKITAECKYDITENEEKNKAFSRQTCWKEHVLGGVLPAGIPVYQSQQMICQRFDKESKLGKSFGQKDAYYATLYDTKKRLPAVSMVTVRALGDEKWPNIPFMIERGLVEEDSSSVVSWFFKNKKKGMTTAREMTSQCEIPACTFGKKQALPSDYDHSGYKILPLLPPDLVGWDIGKKISTLTMTNAIPVEPTLYSAWRRSHQLVRKFAVDTCRIPLETPSQDEQTHRHDGHDLPELYLLSGTVAPNNHYEVIGNDVIVPQIIWLAACCAHGAEVSSFGVYMYNNFGENPAVVSLEQLHDLLQSAYYDNIEEIKIDLYPAFDSLCSAGINDMSYKMKMP